MKNPILIGLPLAATFPAMRRLASEVVRATQGVVAALPASTPVLCRDAGEPIVLAADQKWEVDVPTEFQWMPGGVHVITPTYGDRTIRLAVRCHEGTARAVQASFEQWRRAMPKQRPFGCVEHREQEAALLPTGFRWDGEKGGVNCACTPTALGAQNVNGRIHRSWSPSFTTDADYGACKCSDCGEGWDACDAAKCSGVMEFPKGARGSVQNPAEVTGVAFSVGSLTNKPAFRSIDPVRAKDGGVVMATWSDAARQAAAEARKREGGGLLRRKHEQARRDHLEEVEQAGKDYANAGTEDEMDATHKTRVAHLASAKAYETGSEVHHHAASLAHLAAKQAMDKVNDEGMGRGHLAHAQVHDALAHNETTHNWVTASLGADKDSVRAHCKDNLYADVPDATEAEAAAYDACVDGGGSHQQAVAELRKKRNPANEAVQSSDAILAKLAQEQPPVRARTSEQILSRLGGGRTGRTAA